MFTILTSSAEDMLMVMFMLSHYQVKFQSFSDAEDPFTTEIVVDQELREDDLRMAEMAFQMNFRQVGKICPSCKREIPEEKTCGHLTFKGQLSDFPFEEVPIKEPTAIPSTNTFTLEPMDSIPAGKNPMNYDSFLMGTRINKRFFAMHSDGPYIVLIDTKKGHRIKITGAE